MRLALPGSALVHGTIVAALFIGFAWPKPDDAPAGIEVTVDIVSLSAVTDNTTETIESDVTETLVSAGAVASASPVVAEVLAPSDAAPVEPLTETLEPTEPMPEAAEPPPTVEPVVTETVEVAELSSIAPSPLAALAAMPMPSLEATSTPPATIEPISVDDLKVAPVPQTLTIARRSEPTYPRPAAQAPPPVAKPQAEPAPQQPANPAPAGNGGASNADSVAGLSGGQQGNEGSGGDAEAAEYPGKVLGKLRRALHYPRGADGAAGEVHVQFTVAANGAPSGIQVVRSSGNAAIDEAGIATVNRAAPFPPIPPAANRSSWTFTVPLAFQQ